MTERITWSGDWSKNVGTVNGVHLFTIYRNHGHNPAGFPFHFEHRFGGFSQVKRCYAAEPVAKERCETVLMNIMTKLGFVPAPDPTEETP
jgi:hypothetical protein